MVQPPAKKEKVLSKDGTTISYHHWGDGPGVVLVHGAMQSAQSFSKLSETLSTRFSVYVPDRRGRGLSGPAREDHDIERECEDIGALLQATGAECLFGLSSGAVICLQAARTLPSIRKVALYEPPLPGGSGSSGSSGGSPARSRSSAGRWPAGRSRPVNWPARYRSELSARRMASAFVTVMHGTGTVSSTLSRLPRFAQVMLMKIAIELDGLTAKAGRVTLKDLVPTMLVDMQVGFPGPISPAMFQGMSADVLLLGGSQSPQYLKDSLSRLEASLPQATRKELSGLGHLSPADGGHPELVAAELIQFFGG